MGKEETKEGKGGTGTRVGELGYIGDGEGSVTLYIKTKNLIVL